jgi:hypothetical protein
MFRSRTLLLFLLKTIVIYGALSAPLSFYDEAYGRFYRNLAGVFFSHFRETGFVKFSERPEPESTHLNIGNTALIRPDGSTETYGININTRYLGYLPTILLISLVLSSPVPWKRRLIALAAGMILVYALILFKQWIFLLWQCEQNPWLNLTDLSGSGKKLLNFFYTFISVTSSSVLYFVVAIWLLVTFRMEDFKVKK